MDTNCLEVSAFCVSVEGQCRRAASSVMDEGKADELYRSFKQYDQAARFKQVQQKHTPRKIGARGPIPTSEQPATLLRGVVGSAARAQPHRTVSTESEAAEMPRIGHRALDLAQRPHRSQHNETASQHVTLATALAAAMSTHRLGENPQCQGIQIEAKAGSFRTALMATAGFQTTAQTPTGALMSGPVARFAAAPAATEAAARLKGSPSTTDVSPVAGAEPWTTGAGVAVPAAACAAQIGVPAAARGVQTAARSTAVTAAAPGTAELIGGTASAAAVAAPWKGAVIITTGGRAPAPTTDTATGAAFAAPHAAVAPR